MVMINDEWLEGELSEATCRLSDQVNSLLDEEAVDSGDELSSLEERIAIRIVEHVMIAENLVKLLRSKRFGGEDCLDLSLK